MGALLFHDLFHLGADAAQIPPIHVRVHVKNRLNVIVVDDHRCGPPLNGHQVRKKLRASRHRSWVTVRLGGTTGRGAYKSIASRSHAGLRTRRGGIDRVGRLGYRRAEQGIQPIDPVLGRLHANAVVDAIIPVHPVVRCHLAAAAERDQHAAGYVALRQTHLRRLDPIHVQADFRLVDHLVNVNIGGSGNMRNPVRELAGYLVVRARVSPDYLQIDGRRNPEVQDLGGDIGRLEEKGRVGESLAESFPELHLIIAGRAVVLLERNQDFAVGAGDGRNLALGEASPAIYDPDVIDQGVHLVGRDHVSYFVFNRGEPYLGLFEAGARWSARIQAHLAGVNVGEEILTHQPCQAQRSDRNGHEGRENLRAMLQGPVQQPDVTEAKALEKPVKYAIDPPNEAFRSL